MYLPGMASRVKRAATWAMRSAPLVMTMNWMMMRMRNITRPTTMLPPTTHLAESGNHRARAHQLPCGIAHAAVEEDHARGGNVERQAEQRGHEQHRGEDREFEGIVDVDGNQDGDHRPRDVQGQQEIQQLRRKGDDQHHHHSDDDNGKAHVLDSGHRLAPRPRTEWEIERGMKEVSGYDGSRARNGK